MNSHNHQIMNETFDIHSVIFLFCLCQKYILLNNILGDSDEKSTVLSLTQRSERTPLTYSQSGNAILNTWRN